ncbi:MAG: Uma2 family endonuclease [Labilithrix sp.]|nr:Uma2 family endonuclease [Labilithrix sp.]
MTSLRARSLQHVRPVVPLDFPSSEPEHERMGQGARHYLLCKALYEILRAAVGDDGTVSCDAFVYFDAANPDRKLAPDGAVKLGVPQHLFDSWKTWERGTPELAFEILSPSDAPERWTFDEKLRRYRALGVSELVVFHTDGEPGRRLRVWDRIDDDLVERVVVDERTPCLTLDAFLLVAPVDELDTGVRLARDADGRELVPTAQEATRLAEAARLREANAREEEARARKLAETERLREANAREAEAAARAHAEAERLREANAREEEARARKLAETERLREADARRDAEARLRELERRLAELEAHASRSR